MEAESMSAWKFFLEVWPVLVTVAGVVIAGMGIIARQAMNKKLFKQDGTLIYVQKKEFDKHQDVCQKQTCRKIDGLMDYMKNMDSNRDQARKEISSEVREMGKQISFLAGEFESFKIRNGG